MHISKSKAAILALGVVLIPTLCFVRARGSDHAGTVEITSLPGADLSDLHIFPDPANPANVVLAMSVHPLISSSAASSTFFDPNVLYQFKIDNVGDGVERQVLQFTFSGTGAGQTVNFAMGRPVQTGIVSTLLPQSGVSGTFNQTFSPMQDVKIFAGVREDPFFFDLEQFFKILPDRATPLTKVYDPTPNMPKAASWRSPGAAVDFLSANKFNVLAIVVSVPKSTFAVAGAAPAKIGVWETTSLLGSSRSARRKK